MGDQGRCEQRSEVFVKIKKKIGGGGVRSGAVGWGRRGQGGCERRIEVFVKFIFFLFFFCGGGGGGGGVRSEGEGG